MKESKSLDVKKYTLLQGIIDEIGRMLGGWIKSQNPLERYKAKGIRNGYLLCLIDTSEQTPKPSHSYRWHWTHRWCRT
jgi:hypothetical protein